MKHISTMLGLVSQIQTPDNRLMGAEVGVDKGDLSAALIIKFPYLKLHMIDSWQEATADSDYRKSGDRMAKRTQRENNQLYQSVLARFLDERLNNRAIVHRLDSGLAADVLRSDYGPGCLDFVFIDADHTYQAVRQDLAAYWPLVRSGGLFAGHDYNHRRYTGVKKAVDEFAKAEAKAVASGLGKVWWVWK